ncbi:Tryptophan decarboxylase [subsurface metagenome]
MKWITSPAATELEEVVTDWLRQMIGLPADFKGVIQDTASVATLCAILAAREKITGYLSNTEGLFAEKLRVYCSSEAHSSIEKAVRIAGIGSDNLVKIKVDNECKMLAEELEQAIIEDRKNGFKPACIVGALGTTGTCATDPIREISDIAGKQGVWFHIDAAFAGTALILPEFRKQTQGIEKADSIVLNPHKWMFTNFDCSTFFVRDEKHLQHTFRLVPGYLHTSNDDKVNDYSNWGIQLGRRFRALKLWFVIRNFGVKGLQEKIRAHIRLAEYFAEKVAGSELFELVVPRNLAVVCFRVSPESVKDIQEINELNAELLERINKSGKAYMSHTVVNRKFTLRFVCAQTNTEKKYVDEALDIIFSLAKELI